jgi:hypothetical protein
MAENTFHILRELVAKAKCKLGWTFRIVDEDGALRMVIRVPGLDAYDENQRRTIDHYFPVPTTTFNEKSWRRWMFEQCRGLENHELGEWFRIGEDRPFVPCHGPGENPYVVHEFLDEIDAYTTQDGSIRPKNTNA